MFIYITYLVFKVVSILTILDIGLKYGRHQIIDEADLCFNPNYTGYRSKMRPQGSGQRTKVHVSILTTLDMGLKEIKIVSLDYPENVFQS